MPGGSEGRGLTVWGDSVGEAMDIAKEDRGVGNEKPSSDVMFI